MKGEKTKLNDVTHQNHTGTSVWPVGLHVEFHVGNTCEGEGEKRAGANGGHLIDRQLDCHVTWHCGSRQYGSEFCDYPTGKTKT